MRGITLRFAGRFLCRLAVDPDPFFEPWGLRGDTLVLPGEPPLDRVIRTSAGSAFVRPLCPRIGVKVAYVEPSYDPWRSLFWNAEVTLEPQTAAEGPFFDEWNGILAPANDSPINFIDLRVSVPREGEVRRSSDRSRGIAQTSRLPDADSTALGSLIERIAPAKGFRQLMRRKRELEQIRQDGEVCVTRERLRLLAISLDAERGHLAYRTPRSWEVQLEEAAHVSLPNELKVAIDTSRAWRAVIMLSRWDYDSMSGVIAGSLTLPLKGP